MARKADIHNAFVDSIRLDGRRGKNVGAAEHGAGAVMGRIWDRNCFSQIDIYLQLLPSWDV